MICLRCGKPPRGVYSKRCICSPLQKNIYYKSVQGSMQLAAASKCSHGRLGFIREAIKRRLIMNGHRKEFDRLFPGRPIDSGILAVKLKAGEGKVFLKKDEKKLTKIGRAGKS